MFNRKTSAQPQQQAAQPAPGYPTQRPATTYSTPGPEPGQNPNARVKLLSRLTAGLAAVTLASAGFGAFALVSTSAQKAELDGSSKATVVAKSAITAGTTITADMLETVKVPAKYRASDAIESVDSIVGHEAATEIASGAQVGGSSVLGSDSAAQLSHRISKDKVAITVDTATASGMAGQLTVNDKVTVIKYSNEISAGADGSASTSKVSDVVVENARVIALGGKSSNTSADYASVTLEVTQDEAEKIKAASQDGIDIMLKPTTSTSASTLANGTQSGTGATSTQAAAGAQAVSNNG